MKIPLIIFSLMIISITGCEKLFLPPDPHDNPVSDFDILWNEFNDHYSLFEFKHINWDSVYEIYKPLVKDNSTPEQLFSVMENMLYILNDGHVYLISPFRAIASNDLFKQMKQRNFSFPIIEKNYLIQPEHSSWGGHFIYAKVSPDIGYIRIPTFEDVDFARVDDWVKGIDGILEEYGNVKGLIIDIRDNGGGDAFNSQAIADRFADKKRLFAYGFSRSGPGYNDFSKPYEWNISPTGRSFKKPVALLTNRWTASAAERFVLAMRIIPSVTIIGDTTEGAFPHAVPRELPNGWSYRVTVGVVIDAKRVNYEGRGIPPDIPVEISRQDSISGKDTILEKAIEILK